MKYKDPSGHDVGCGGMDCSDYGKTNSYKVKYEPIQGYNFLDLVPVMQDIRHIKRGYQTMKWVTQQQEFLEQENVLQNWYDACYGQCHYSEYLDLDFSSLDNGPMPTAPLVDTYSTGMAETTSGAMSLLSYLAVGAVGKHNSYEMSFGGETITLPNGKTVVLQRFAPFGNKGYPVDLSKLNTVTGWKAVTGNLPHLHIQVLDSAGQVIPGWGLGWHTPWDQLIRSLLGQ